MKRLVPIMAASLALAGCGDAAHHDHNEAGNEAASNGTAATTGPVVRLPAVPGRPAAGYFDYRVAGDRGALLSVSSPQARRIEMHETMNMGGMSEMRPLARIAVRDGETLHFAPGGRHLMLFDISRDVAAGGRIDLILRFERGEPVTISATLVPTGGDI
ncbi:MAG TPA: copper chaperone PCu(A)C [Allosphingosinicella sp.]|jgi:copper(I)-binding protein|nr:copper chaperone PCu(A)C [Allosphingosinicella sp.]